MRIANPIYDVFFKYLMEDTEIAKGLLSEIIQEDIIEIQVKPQEESSRSEQYDIIIFRLDFKAVIQTKTGDRKKILIELQKGKNPTDILRFRRYLGENYQKVDSYLEKGQDKTSTLPIITIYFLGFPLESIATSVIKVNREYVDLISGSRIRTRERFIEQLTHDSYIIQIRRLTGEVRTELERLLRVFNQTYVTKEDRKILELKESDIVGNELLEKIVNRLREAATNEEILKKARLEEEVEETIEQHIREKQELSEENSELKGENSELKGENSELKGENSELKGENIKLKEELERLKELLDKGKK